MKAWLMTALASLAKLRQSQASTFSRWRLRKYDNPRNNGVVAVRGRECIAKALKSDAEVRVFTTAVPTSIPWNGLPIDLIAGLEEGLIRKLQPRWNVRGLSALRKRGQNSN